MAVDRYHDVVVRRLVELVPRWASSQADRGVYALVLGYEVGESPLPPSLSLGTADRREAADGESDPDERRRQLWAPADLPVFDPVPTVLSDDPELAEACEVLEGGWRVTLEEEAPRKLLVRAAKELNSVQWGGLLDTTDHFVVLAVDFELEDLRRNAKASLPKDKLEALRRQGFL